MGISGEFSTTASQSITRSDQIQGVDSTPHIPSYQRSQWLHWVDDDGDCQDTRQEVLIEESLVEVTYESERQCRVETGLWVDIYTGDRFTDPSDLDVDHFIPLAEAHESGGWAWDEITKRRFANDLEASGHLIAVSASANRSKGASDPADWLPPDESAWCFYVRNWSEIKKSWGLDFDDHENRVINEVLVNC